MAVTIWVQQKNLRSETFYQYKVEVRLVPEEIKTYSASLLAERTRSELSVHPERPMVSVEFRGEGLSRSSVPFEPAHPTVAGFSLPKADAMRLAQSILIACSSDGTEGVSVIPLDETEQEHSLSNCKVVFSVAKGQEKA